MEILVVTSKVKQFIKSKSNMNTSAETVEALTEHVSRVCERAIAHAEHDKRKTVMARDIQAALDSMAEQ